LSSSLSSPAMIAAAEAVEAMRAASMRAVSSQGLTQDDDGSLPATQPLGHGASSQQPHVPHHFRSCDNIPLAQIRPALLNLDRAATITPLLDDCLLRERIHVPRSESTVALHEATWRTIVGHLQPGSNGNPDIARQLWASVVSPVAAREGLNHRAFPSLLLESGFQHGWILVRCLISDVRKRGQFVFPARLLPEPMSSVVETVYHPPNGAAVRCQVRRVEWFTPIPASELAAFGLKPHGFLWNRVKDDTVPAHARRWLIREIERAGPLSDAERIALTRQPASLPRRTFTAYKRLALGMAAAHQSEPA
jgi:hypothetical protein